MGLKGDQDINFAQNKTLAEFGFNGVQVLLFNSSKPNYYQYAGEVHLVGEPFYQTQQDEDNKNRKVVVFPLKKLRLHKANLIPYNFLTIFSFSNSTPLNPNQVFDK